MHALVVQRFYRANGFDGRRVVAMAATVVEIDEVGGPAGRFGHEPGRD